MAFSLGGRLGRIDLMVDQTFVETVGGSGRETCHRRPAALVPKRVRDSAAGGKAHFSLTCGPACQATAHPPLEEEIVQAIAAIRHRLGSDLDAGEGIVHTPLGIHGVAPAQGGEDSASAGFGSAPVGCSS